MRGSPFFRGVGRASLVHLGPQDVVDLVGFYFLNNTNHNSVVRLIFLSFYHDFHFHFKIYWKNCSQKYLVSLWDVLLLGARRFRAPEGAAIHLDYLGKGGSRYIPRVTGWCSKTKTDTNKQIDKQTYQKQQQTATCELRYLPLVPGGAQALHDSCKHEPSTSKQTNVQFNFPGGAQALHKPAYSRSFISIFQLPPPLSRVFFIFYNNRYL